MAEKGPRIRGIAPIAKITPIQMPLSPGPRTLVYRPSDTVRPKGNATVMRAKPRMNLQSDRISGPAYSNDPTVMLSINSKQPVSPTTKETWSKYRSENLRAMNFRTTEAIKERTPAATKRRLTPSCPHP
mmetsp:Transcript_3410/g.7990  ORF Transcript_3410/g.7990 Transcript_3410/m.7990 type:complete len:129 (+) Transcript_3410:598-984(+)